MPYDAAITGYLFEHARDIILVVDAEHGGIVHANRAAAKAYRYSLEQLLGLKIFDLRIEASSTVSHQMELASASGLLFETVHRRSDGTTFPVEVSSRGETMAGRRCLFSVVRDITERKRFEVEREDLLLDTQRALAMRDEFLMIASHELRAPVTNISLQLQQLSRLIERGVPRAHLRIVGAAALGEAGRLTALIDALLDAQAVKGQLVLDRSEVDLAELVGDVVGRLRTRVEQAGSPLVIDVPSIRGYWDRMRIDQVVSNLLLNALKYGRGRPVRVAAEADDHAAQIEISDQGIGVPVEDVSRIFDKFERAVPAHYGGLGLGLFITRQIVDAHDGVVHVESTPGVGSTFRVTLPRGGEPA